MPHGIRKSVINFAPVIKSGRRGRETPSVTSHNSTYIQGSNYFLLSGAALIVSYMSGVKSEWVECTC